MRWRARDESGDPSLPPPAPAAADTPHMQPAPVISPPRCSAAWEECTLDRRLHLFSALMHGSAQYVSLLAWRTLPLGERLQRVGSVLMVLTFYMVVRLAPAAYLRRRAAFLAAERLLFFAFPLLRQPRGECCGLGCVRREARHPPHVLPPVCPPYVPPSPCRRRHPASARHGAAAGRERSAAGSAAHHLG